MHREEKDTMYKAMVRTHSILKSVSKGIELYRQGGQRIMAG